MTLAPRGVWSREGLARLPWWAALWLSLGVHSLVFLALFGQTVEVEEGSGEEGQFGAGGDQLEITVVSGVPASTRTAEPTPESPPVPTPTPQRVRRERRTEPPQPPAEAPAELNPAEAASAVARAEVAAGLPTDTPGESSSSGRAAGARGVEAILGSLGLGGSSAETRALLGDALRCDDPIAGTWVAHRYSPEFHDWARMTLKVHRDGERLEGVILSRTWSGGASDRIPPPCMPGGHDVTVRMEARGSFRGSSFVFGADSHRIVSTDCPSPVWNYNPDRFSGRLEPSGEELFTLNNDGGRDVDAPYRFHRTDCEH